MTARMFGRQANWPNIAGGVFPNQIFTQLGGARDRISITEGP
jgi:hypothetical protein